MVLLYKYILLLICVSFSVVNFILFKLNPVLDMALRSQCKNPLTSWDGKLFGFSIWFNYYSNIPKYYSVHHNNREHSNDLWVNSNHLTSSSLRRGLEYTEIRNRRPIILFGSHHKTGTYLANKIFSVVCARMNWCCMFHSTRLVNAMIYHTLDIANAIIMFASYIIMT